MSQPTFYIPPDRIKPDTATLHGDELRHARSTLRLKPGDRIRVVDGAGSLYEAAIKTMGKDEATVDILSVEKEPVSPFSLTVAMGVVKGERFDWALQKGTELGVTAFIPLLSERIDIKPGESWKRLPRLQRVVQSACKQSGRARFPVITEPVAIGDLDPGEFDQTILFWEGKSQSLSEIAPNLSKPSSCLMVIGPVGGLTPAEAKAIREKGAIVAGLGPRVLRTETAVTAGVALLQYLWGDVG